MLTFLSFLSGPLLCPYIYLIVFPVLVFLFVGRRREGGTIIALGLFTFPAQATWYSPYNVETKTIHMLS